MQHRYSFVVALAMSLGCAMLQPAAAADSAAPAAQMSIDDLKTRLALTPEQQEKIAPLAEERRSKMEAIRSKFTSATSRGDKREVMKEAKAIQNDFTSKVEPLLTPEQQTEWKKIREEMRAQMMEKWRNRK